MLRVVRDHIELPQTCAEGCAAPPLLMVVAPHPLNLVCFRHVGGDEPTEALLAALNGTGRVFLTHTRLDGRFVIRVAIGAQATEARHVDGRSEEHTSEPPSLMRISYAVFFLKKKKSIQQKINTHNQHTHLTARTNTP